jgi:hypothetical protein
MEGRQRWRESQEEGGASAIQRESGRGRGVSDREMAREREER